MSVTYAPSPEHIHEHLKEWYNEEDPMDLFEHMVMDTILVVTEIVFAQEVMKKMGLV
jgi:hypothetical protein